MKEHLGAQVAFTNEDLEEDIQLRKGLLSLSTAPRDKEREARPEQIYLLSLYAIILFLCSTIVFLLLRAPRDPSQLIYSPAANIIEYKVVDFGKNFLRRSEYMPKLSHLPTDEIDALWLDLHSHGESTISKRQADHLQIKTQQMPGSEKYLIELDVFHQLHCLDLVRKALYPDRYGQWEYREDGTVNTMNTTFLHWEHCIDAIRQTLMCHGDISPLQFRVNGINGVLAPDLATRHTCRNFEGIRQWAKEREAPYYANHVAPGLVKTNPGFTLEDLIATEV